LDNQREKASACLGAHPLPPRSKPELWSKIKPLVREKRRAPTEAEAMLWQRLRGRGLHGHKFQRQHPVGRFIVDFYCPVVQLVIEVDGPIHAAQLEDDALRQAELEALGLRVIRFSNDGVMADLERVLDEIARNLTPQPPL
jgi:very-short-patch-repair endonuclease